MSISVTALYRYPVKSLQGESHNRLSFAERGAVGDRVWAVRDEVRGGIRGAKKIPSLMTLSAHFLTEPQAEGSSPARITAPDGSTRETDSTDINAWLSEKLGHPVTLWPLLPADALDHYRRGAPDSDDFEQELREMFARNADEPLPDLDIFSEVIEFESPPGTYFDAFPVLLLSRQSLASMARHRPESQFHVDRFRPNILLDVPDSDHPFPEAQWLGQQIRIGDLVLEAVGECPRCAMTTHAFGDLPKDPGIMRGLVQANNGNIGLYAKVVQAGTIQLGDSLTLAPAEPDV